MILYLYVLKKKPHATEICYFTSRNVNVDPHIICRLSFYLVHSSFQLTFKKKATSILPFDS